MNRAATLTFCALTVFACNAILGIEEAEVPGGPGGAGLGGAAGEGGGGGGNNAGSTGVGGMGGAPPLTLSGIEQLALGVGHSCALLKGGTAVCWGSNDKGQLGHDPPGAEPALTPQTVLLNGEPLTNIVGLTVAQNSTCALLEDKTARCWGANEVGQLGSGTTAASGSHVPRPVVDEKNATLGDIEHLALGAKHGCALVNGSPLCWGDNSGQQLGYDTGETNAPSAVARPVGSEAQVAPEDIKALALGATHSCALNQAGKAFCWGSNVYGQVGLGAAPNTTTLVPVPVTNEAAGAGGAAGAAGAGGDGMGGAGPSPGEPLASIVQLVAGSQHTCARLSDGTARCWGYNPFGQLGSDSGLFRPAPQPVSAPGSSKALGGITQLALGEHHSCASVGEKAYCWGSNTNGQLGDGSFTTSRNLSPRPVLADATKQELAGVTRLVLGAYHTCALTGDTARCWGLNDKGQLGGGAASKGTPRPTKLLAANVTRLALGDNHGCAIVNGLVSCWGADGFGQLGDGSTGVGSYVPKSSLDADAAPLGAERIALGANTTCALGADALLRCWGQNSSGQLGNGTTTANAVPQQVLTSAVEPVTSLANVARVAVGTGHACAVVGEGAYCWGENANGQLGYATTDNLPSTVAQAVVDATPAALAPVGEIALGGQTSCALMKDDTVRCWGLNGNGQLGNGTTNAAGNQVPQAVLAEGGAALADVDQVVVGAKHACALSNDGKAFCWGSNSDGQMGDGNYGINATRAQPVLDASQPLGNVRQLAAGANFSCALLEAGEARCWGGNEVGQLGRGDLERGLSPRPVLGGDGQPLKNIAEIFAGTRSACARLTGGDVYCWGENASGQLGDGTTSNSLPLPQPVLAAETAQPG